MYAHAYMYARMCVRMRVCNYYEVMSMFLFLLVTFCLGTLLNTTGRSILLNNVFNRFVHYCDIVKPA